MPHYFFDTGDGDLDRDSDGVELIDDEAARLEAIRYLGAVLCDRPDELPREGIFRVTVRSANGEAIVALVARDISRVR